MRRVMLLLRTYVWRSFLQWMAWRAFLITLVINQAVTPLLGFAIWSKALPGASGVSTYYLALLIVQLMTVSYEHHTLSNGIYAGAFGNELVKPQAPILVSLGENIAMRIWHVILGIPLFLGLWLVADISVGGQSALVAIPAVFLSATIRFLFTFTLALSAFWTQQAHGTVNLGQTLIFLLGGSAAPIAFFPEEFRRIGEYLPFRAMLGFPAEIAAGGVTQSQTLAGYGAQVFWLGTFLVLAYIVWRSGIRRFTAVGG
jgi:ABC-2 type transport system permease protein